jgi:hypothetical protein
MMTLALLVLVSSAPHPADSTRLQSPLVFAWCKGVPVYRGITYWELKARLGNPARVTLTDNHLLAVYGGNWGTHYFTFRRGLLEEHWFLGGY